MPQRRHIGGAHIAVLMLIGLALFSMLISLLRERLEALSKAISQGIKTQYLLRLQRENPDAPPPLRPATSKDQPLPEPIPQPPLGKDASKTKASIFRGLHGLATDDRAG